MCLHCDNTVPLQHSLWWMWHPTRQRPKERLSPYHFIIHLKDTDKKQNVQKRGKNNKEAFCPAHNNSNDYLFSCAPSVFLLLRLVLQQSSLLFACAPTSPLASPLHFPFREEKKKGKVAWEICATNIQSQVQGGRSLLYLLQTWVISVKRQNKAEVCARMWKIPAGRKVRQVGPRCFLYLPPLLSSRR